jgi:competence protein ComEA
VHVAGAVERPGLYRVRVGARVAAAIERAGGPTPKADLTGTNLAARVEDGQQVVVPVRGVVSAASAPPGAATPAGPISLATATQPQLEELDGIGPTLAARILEYRDTHGGFRSIEELAEVDGIGEVRLEALREAVQP